MGTLAILALIFGIVGAVTSVGLGISQNETNTKAVQDTNATNYKIAQETNQSNVEQANFAYQRSLPLNQVNNLMAAGMSRQGALSSLTGGGTYTAPTLQSSQMQAPQKDYSGIASAMERLQNIPANVEQSQLIDQQRHALAVDTQNKINADARAQEQHEFDMWKQGYDKNTALMLDSGSSKVANALIDSGKTIEDFKDFESMIRDLGLAGDKDIRNLTHVARQQLEDGVRSKFDAERSRQDQENANRASDDAHNLSILEEKLKKIDVKYYDKEKHEQLLNLIRTGQNLVQDGNIKFQDYTSKEMENFVRSAGINSEHEARALAEYVHKLENEDELNMQLAGQHSTKFTREGRTIGRLLLRDFGEILSRVKLP